jgi:uncharacterized protein YceK
MKWVRAALVAVAVAVPPCGCGTVMNLASTSPNNYGGVQRDIQFATDASAGGGVFSGQNNGSVMSVGNSSDKGAIIALAVLALYGADLSLCFVADTLTLPLAIYLRQRHEGATDSAAAPVN